MTRSVELCREGGRAAGRQAGRQAPRYRAHGTPPPPRHPLDCPRTCSACLFVCVCVRARARECVCPLLSEVTLALALTLDPSPNLRVWSSKQLSKVLG